MARHRIPWLILTSARVSSTSGKSEFWKGWHFCGLEYKGWDYGGHSEDSSPAYCVGWMDGWSFSASRTILGFFLSGTLFTLLLDDDTQDSNCYLSAWLKLFKRVYSALSVQWKKLETHVWSSSHDVSKERCAACWLILFSILCTSSGAFKSLPWTICMWQLRQEEEVPGNVFLLGQSWLTAQRRVFAGSCGQPWGTHPPSGPCIQVGLCEWLWPVATTSWSNVIQSVLWAKWCPHPQMYMLKS